MPCSPFLTRFLLADANFTEVQVRLANGPNRCAGRVEVFHEHQWGTICDDSWDLKDAKVICRQLGCGTAVSVPDQAHFGHGLDPIWLDNVECTGMETTLSQCGLSNWGLHNCNHDEDAGVVCSGGPREGGDAQMPPKKGFYLGLGSWQHWWDVRSWEGGGEWCSRYETHHGMHAHPCMRVCLVCPSPICLRGWRGRLTPFASSCRHKPLAGTAAGWLRSLRGTGGGALQRYLAWGVQHWLEPAGSRGGLQAAGLRASLVGACRSPARLGGRPRLAGGAELPGH